jgi:glycosyltransferase involved in cell wall biosynthesis
MQGGVGDYTRELSRALVHLGHSVRVLTSAAARDPAASRAEDEPAVDAAVPRWNWRCLSIIRSTVQRYRPDVLHIQYQTAAYGMHPAINSIPVILRMAGVQSRSLVTFHDLRVPYLFPKAGKLRGWVNALMARQCHGVVATNPEDLHRLQTLGLPRIQMIPIGSNIHPPPSLQSERSLQRRTLGIGDDQVLLCYFGFLNASKGGKVLFRALAELIQRGQAAKLLMIGGQVGTSDPTNESYLRDVKALAAELGIADRILWTGFVPPERVSANFAAADICVLPYMDGASFRRGSFMAALAHGMPIVSSTPHFPIPDLQQGENILLVPPGDANATASAVEHLLREPKLRSRLARGALRLAQEFRWDHIASRTVAFYKEVLDN